MTQIKETVDIPSFLQKKTGVDVYQCYQCGKCTAGCVLAEDMDYPPSYILRFLQTGLETDYKKVLSSNTIWMCLNCENCIGRCPKEVDIPVLMDFLRQESREKKLVSPKARQIIAFHQSFLDSVKHTGRLYEAGLVADYKLRTKRHLWQDMKLVPKMLKRGKLSFLPEVVKDRKKISDIFNHTIDKKLK
mgnify:CR=1 FL=1